MKFVTQYEVEAFDAGALDKYRVVEVLIVANTEEEALKTAESLVKRAHYLVTGVKHIIPPTITHFPPRYGTEPPNDEINGSLEEELGG